MTSKLILDANLQSLAGEKIPFSPELGDLIEFESDKQTEAGPSSGKVVGLEANKVLISHSDKNGEMFDKFKVDVLKHTPNHTNGRGYWLLAALKG